jgi:hypothetical protein
LSNDLAYAFFQKCCSANVVLYIKCIILFIIEFYLNAGGFILSGPLIYKNHVVADFESEKTSFGASWYMALISAGMTLILGIGRFLHSCWTCRVIYEKKRQSVSRDKSGEKRKQVFTI